MTCIETGNGWEMRRGDCLDPVTGLASLANESVDVVITDPPYEAEAHTLERRVVRRPGGAPDAGFVGVEALDFQPITAAQRVEVAAHIARISRHRAVVFCQPEAIAAWRDAFNRGGMPYRRSLPWTKPDAMPSYHGRWPGQAYEAIVLAMHPSAPPCPIGGKAKRYEFNKNGLGAAPHPTTKPMPLMRELVNDFTRPGDLVLDPFAGSGSTGVACRMLGRRFVGWERDPTYFEIACRRLAGDEAKPRAEQPSLFGER
jgi:site-specific DNA-methyltransferase (adenine-specific)